MPHCVEHAEGVRHPQLQPGVIEAGRGRAKIPENGLEDPKDLLRSCDTVFLKEARVRSFEFTCADSSGAESVHEISIFAQGDCSHQSFQERVRPGADL